MDKAPNLAGLCRTLEILHCEALVVGDLKVTQDGLFQRISVTSNKWFPIQVQPDGRTDNTYTDRQTDRQTQRHPARVGGGTDNSDEWRGHCRRCGRI